jgi:hypothetical protein
MVCTLVSFEKAKSLAMFEILELREQMAIMGSNDSEFPTVQQILDDLSEDKITPEEAVSSTRQILDSKQDYH